jgi:plastocyanin domain-containing protein
MKWEGGDINMFHAIKKKTIIIICSCVILIAGMTAICLAIAHSARNSAKAATEASVIDGIQDVTTDLTANGYPNITVQKDVPLVWNLRADTSVLNSCNGTMIISEYNIHKELNVGDNIITFTPKKEGTINYSCAMGMVTGQITVVDNLELLKK